MLRDLLDLKPKIVGSCLHFQALGTKIGGDMVVTFSIGMGDVQRL
jgi:anthranilate/para-aminobenzoate synthase component II